MQQVIFVLLGLAALSFLAGIQWLFIALLAIALALALLESRPSGSGAGVGGAGGAGASAAGGGASQPQVVVRQPQVVVQQTGGTWYDQFYADTISEAKGDFEKMSAAKDHLDSTIKAKKKQMADLKKDRKELLKGKAVNDADVIEIDNQIASLDSDVEVAEEALDKLSD